MMNFFNDKSTGMLKALYPPDGRAFSTFATKGVTIYEISDDDEDGEEEKILDDPTAGAPKLCKHQTQNKTSASSTSSRADFIKNEENDNAVSHEELLLRSLSLLSISQRKNDTEPTQVTCSNENLQYYCYLLRSLKKGYQHQSYIGCTNNPEKRIQQHNGALSVGGAKKTSNHRPWEMEVIITGFKDRSEALKFEWAWQHPKQSRHFISHHQQLQDSLCPIWCRCIQKYSNSKVFRRSLLILKVMLCCIPYWKALELEVFIQNETVKAELLKLKLKNNKKALYIDDKEINSGIIQHDKPIASFFQTTKAQDKGCGKLKFNPPIK